MEKYYDYIIAETKVEIMSQDSEVKNETENQESSQGGEKKHPAKIKKFSSGDLIRRRRTSHVFLKLERFEFLKLISVAN